MQFNKTFPKTSSLWRTSKMLETSHQRHSLYSEDSPALWHQRPHNVFDIKQTHLKVCYISATSTWPSSQVEVVEWTLLPYLQIKCRWTGRLFYCKMSNEACFSHNSGVTVMHRPMSWGYNLIFSLTFPKDVSFRHQKRSALQVFPAQGCDPWT